jgi:hypothetical protein
MVRLYVNGVEEGTAVGVNALWTAGDRFYVGNTNAGGGFFDGLIDDVRIYEQSLSATRIQAIYGALTPLIESGGSAQGRVETWRGSIIAVGSRIGEGEPGTFPATLRDSQVGYGAGSFEYCPQRKRP